MKPPEKLRCRRQRCAMLKSVARCRPEQPPELLHHGTILLKPHIQERCYPCPREASAQTPRRDADEKPLVPATLRGGLASSTASNSSAKNSDI
jgi:hypothetical protein